VLHNFGILCSVVSSNNQNFRLQTFGESQTFKEYFSHSASMKEKARRISSTCRSDIVVAAAVVVIAVVAAIVVVTVVIVPFVILMLQVFSCCCGYCCCYFCCA